MRVRVALHQAFADKPQVNPEVGRAAIEAKAISRIDEKQALVRAMPGFGLRVLVKSSTLSDTIVGSRSGFVRIREHAVFFYLVVCVLANGSIHISAAEIGALSKTDTRSCRCRQVIFRALRAISRGSVSDAAI